MSEILKGLNDEQLKAVTSIDGAYRLVAGAGSGKTFTLTRRVAYICETKGITPNRVLCLTFTNKAAKEMSERLAKLMNISEDDICMSTYHHFAYQILERDYKNIFNWKSLKIVQTSASILVPEWMEKNKSQFSTLDNETVKALEKYLVSKVHRALSNDYYVEWLDKSYGRVPLASVGDVLKNMEADTNYKKAYDSYKRAVKTYGTKDKVEPAAKKLESVTQTYKEGEVTPTGTWVRAIVQSKNGLVTFDDIVKMAVYLLEKYPDILGYWQNQFDYIQGDEFQDTDFKQLKILQLLYKKHGNLFVVGDPDQSIYLFRGAEPTVLTNLSEYIPNLKTIFMVKNYRSTDEIVNISDKVITLNKNRIKKICKSQHGKGNAVEVISADDAYSVANKQFSIIKNLIASGVETKDIAILYSNKNDEITQNLQQLFETNNIEYNSTLLLDDPTYKNATLSICKYIHTNYRAYLYEAASFFDDQTGTSALNIKAFDNVKLDTDSIYSAFDSMKKGYLKNGNPSAEYKRFLDASTGVHKDIDDVINNWNSLSNDDKDKACTEDSVEILGGIQPAQGGGISILTIHRSKGLEYEYVFINGLDADTFISNRDSGSVCEEKARLAYVGYSRAKKQLYIGISTDKTPSGVIGQIINEPYVNRDDAIAEKCDNAVNTFLDTIDGKMVPVYRKLIYKDKVEGYRCEFYLHGEKIGYNANIQDLERLNCVPKEAKLLVFVGDDLKVTLIENGHMYTHDDMEGLINVIDLKTDAEILEVFKGSNTPYTKDKKDSNNMSNIYNSHKDEPMKFKQALKDLKLSRDNNKDTINEKPSDNQNICSEQKILLKAIDKKTKQPLGVRVVKGNKYVDLNIDQMKNRNISFENCTGTVEIKTDEKKFTYKEVYDYNTGNKGILKECKIIQAEFSTDTCTVLIDNNTFNIGIYELISSIESKRIYVTNLSKLKLWRNFI